MANCKVCDKEFETGIKDCCSEDCFKKDIQRRINEATKNEKSHTTSFSKE